MTAPIEPQKTSITMVHVAGVLLIVACVLLAALVFKDNNAVQVLLVSAATGLYGALGFKPIDSVIVQALRNWSPTKVVQNSSIPNSIIDVIKIVEAAKNDRVRAADPSRADEPVVVAVPMGNTDARAVSIPPGALNVPILFEEEHKSG